MAKLSKGNLAAKKDVQVSKVDNWNPPLVFSSTAAQMPPPTSRPLPRLPTTPSGNSHTRSSNSELQDSSSKKKRRRRGGKRNGDSASEVTTNISEDTGQGATSPTHNRSEVLVPASQSSLSLLPPNASAEEIRVFQNEPEIFGVFASSDEEDQEEGKRPITIPLRRTRAQTYSPSIAMGLAESSPVRRLREESVQSLQAGPTRPQIGSDVLPSSTAQIPKPGKLPNGRFECPFKVEYGCTKTFGGADSARRHAGAHVNADRFKCDICDKGFSRQDTFARHLRAHGKQDDTAKQVGTTRTKNVKEAHSNGVVDAKKITNASSINFDSGVDDSDDEAVVQTKTDNPAEEATATGDHDSVQSETDEEEQPNTNGNAQDHNSQRSDNQHSGTEKEHSAEQPNTGNIPASPSERTIVSSPMRALSPAEKNQFPTVSGGTKRKRPSSRASPEFEISSHKRVRREHLQSPPKSRETNAREKNNVISSPVRNSPVVDSKAPQDVNVEVNAQDDQEQTEESDSEEIMESDLDPASKADVEMKDDEQVQDSDHESTSGSDEEAARVPTPVTEEVEAGEIMSADTIGNDDDSAESASEEREEDGFKAQEDARDNSDIEPDSGSPHNRTKRSDRPAPAMRRQSSMDSFVQRSKSATTSTKASGSRPRVSVDIPVRPRTQSKKTQSRLRPQRQVEAHRSTQSPNVSAADDLEGEESAQRTESKAGGEQRVRPLNKGKGKARVEDNDNTRTTANETEEKTSSEDRPRATTVARRTSSVGSKSKSLLRNRTVPKKRSKPESDTDESEQIEKPKSKSKKPSKKKSKPLTEEDSGEDNKAERKRPASTAKSTWAEASKSGVTGKFSDEEIQTLNSWRDSFCEENNLSAYEFNEMMMNTASVSKTDWRYGWITKADFMQQYYEQLPNRNRRSMIRYRERTFANADKTPWTEAHDKELRSLVAERGTKWVEIAQIMGRTQDSVNQRWRHKLNYGEKPALMGEWTTEEVQKLEDEVMAFAESKNTTPDDEDLQIPWMAISKKMGNGRTAQQCSNRWRINTSRRINGKFVKVPHNDRLPGTKVKKPRTPSKMEKRLSGKGTSKTNTPKSEKVYKSEERVENSESEEEANRDADDESNDAQGNEVPGVDDEQEELDNNEEESEAAPDEDEQEHNSQQSDENAESSSEEPEMIPESEQGPSSSEDVPQKSVTATTQPFDPSTTSTMSSPKKIHKLSQNTSSSQPIPNTTQDISHSHSQSPSSSQPQPLPSSSQAPTLKTPGISKNPLKRISSRNRSSPSHGLTLSQIHAGTQANSSAKRTTGRTNRTRVPDSAVTEDRPSPGLSLRRRPVRSSSPLMSPLPDVARGSAAGDGDEDEDEEDKEESGSERSRSGNLELDFKSPTSFVSARDTAEVSDEDEDDDEDEQSNTDSDSDSSSSSSDSDSSSDSNSNNPTTTTTHQDSGSFWQSVNQNFRKLTGLSQEGSGSGSGEGRSQSQGASQGRSQNRKKGKGRVSLADVLRREAVEESASEDEDDDD